MKSSVRAGSLLVAVAGALALPAGVSAQLDPAGDVGQAVEQSVPPIEAPTPARDVTAPSAPPAPAPAPRQAPAAGNRAPAAAPPAAGPATLSRSSAPARPAERKARRTRSSGRSGAQGSAAAKAHAASAAGAERALAQLPDDGPVTTAQASSFTAGAKPDTGTIGDSRLPFTGAYALPFLALGAGVLLAGFALRTSPRLRAARRRAH